MSTQSEDEQFHAAVAPDDGVEWQGELDTALADIDTRLRHPRRRATDAGPVPKLPELGKVEMTSALLDEIAWRVAEKLRDRQATEPGSPATADNRIDPLDAVAALEAVLSPSAQAASPMPPPPPLSSAAPVERKEPFESMDALDAVLTPPLSRGSSSSGRTPLPPPPAPTMPHGVALVIRLRWPLFRLPWGSKKRERSTSFNKLRVT